MFQIGDRVKFSPEFIAAVHKKARNQEEAEKRIYTVVDVRMWEPHLLIDDEEKLPVEVKTFRAFLREIVETKAEDVLTLIGNHQPEQKICINGPGGEQVWLRASYFILAS